jgi:glycosyltransferase involved in cell wall biosynthesis
MGVVGMIAGMLRVKNEARWIEAVLSAALEACNHVFVMDDSSTDDTVSICRQFRARVTVLPSPFKGLDEARDKNWLLGRILALGAPGWILAIDGDEQLRNPEAILKAILSGASECYALQVLYLWDRRDQMRTDGVYGRFWRPSLFRVRPGDSFPTTRNGGNFHCGNVPKEFSSSVRSEAQLLHFGYMEAEDRRRKFDWYNQQDPNNETEQRYLHVIQGDAGGPAVQLTLRHAGPLTLGAI